MGWHLAKSEFPFVTRLAYLTPTWNTFIEDIYNLSKMRWIIAVVNANIAVTKRKSAVNSIRLTQESNPWPLLYPCIPLQLNTSVVLSYLSLFCLNRALTHVYLIKHLFCDIGGVFHLVFFQDMEIIWASRPSMLLARQAIILHLQHNTSFTVITSINNFWGKEWKEYIDDKIPAFLLLTDAENIPWENSRRKTRELQFFFRSLLLHSLGFGLNCVFIAGVEMTATKVMGYYIESTHKMYYRQVRETTSPWRMFQWRGSPGRQWKFNSYRNHFM